MSALAPEFPERLRTTPIRRGRKYRGVSDVHPVEVELHPTPACFPRLLAVLAMRQPFVAF